MDIPQYTSTPMDELRRIEADVRRARNIDELRIVFGRLQMLRRAFVDDFDLQLAIGQVQQAIVDRGRGLMERKNGAVTAPFEGSLFDQPPAAKPGTPSAETPKDEHPVSHPLPAGVEPMDARSWKRSIYIGAFFAILLFAGFFYLIQMARRLNLAPQQPVPAVATNQNGKSGAKPQVQPVSNPAQPVAPTGPSLRLYTDLVPGTVAVDGGTPQDLQDGELQLDTLAPGKHDVKVTGRSGDAAFSFNVEGKSAPRLTGPPSGSNAMVVTVSVQDGKGQLMTNAQDATAIVDNKPAGVVSDGGLPLENLGVIDHDLEIKRAHDSQRFILTYTAAPALTVFVKSDPNAGSLVVIAGEDGVDVFVNDKPYRRKTEHGQIRIPSLKVGAYTIRVKKAGFLDPPAQTVQIKKGEESRVEFHMQMAPQFAALQIRGGQPGTMILLDKEYVTTVAPDGSATLANLKPGDHTLDLRRDGFQPKHLVRAFKAGDTVILTGPDVALEKMVAESKPAPMPPPEPVPSPAANESQPATVPATVHRGGGFVALHTPKGAQHYTFTLQLRKGGGFLKAKRLQWFVDYQDSKNYVLYQVDGKHFTIREVVDGKSKELQKVPFNGEPDEFVGVDISLKPNSVDTRLRSADGTWRDMGPVTSLGRDFTQGKVGVLVPGNDEVGVSTVRIGK